MRTSIWNNMSFRFQDTSRQGPKEKKLVLIAAAPTRALRPSTFSTGIFSAPCQDHLEAGCLGLLELVRFRRSILHNNELERTKNERSGYYDTFTLLLHREVVHNRCNILFLHAACSSNSSSKPSKRSPSCSTIGLYVSFPRHPCFQLRYLTF